MSSNFSPKEIPVTPLPASTTVTKDRQLVDTSQRVWQFRVSNDGGRIIKINWSVLERDASPISLSPRTIELFQLYLRRKLGFSKGHTIRNDFAMLRRFFRWLRTYDHINKRNEPFDWEMADEKVFRLFLEHGLRTGERGNDFSRLRDFYCWGAFVQHQPEFNEQLALSLRAVRARGNVKGAAVRFRDIVKGPLDRAEQRLVIDALRGGQGRAKDRAVVMVHLELGINPNSTVRLKNRDLLKFELNAVENGNSIIRTLYQLAIPRVKKRKEYREVKVRPISRELGTLLEALKKGGPDEPLFHWLVDYYPEGGVDQAIKRFAEEANVVSPRTGRTLWLAPRRFRYTLGTEAAREGASPARIAELLDHTDLQNVKVYVEASSYVVNQLGKRFDEVFGPIARRFRGKVVDSHREPAFPGVLPKIIPSTSLHLPVLPVDVGGIGMCGRDIQKHGLCRLAPPLTCYPCEFFAAFRDGPHAEVLQALEEIQEELKKSSDVRIPMQLEEVTAAAKQLVAQISAERKQTNDVSS
jgi:hypothetical protein